MTSLYRKVLGLLAPEERRKLYFLIVAMLGMGIIEVVGVSSIMPFMAVLSEPENITSNPAIFWCYNYFNFKSYNNFLFFIGIGVLVILVINNVFTIVINWMILRFCWLRNHMISQYLLQRYISMPYDYFLNKNTSDLKKNILSEVTVVVLGIIKPILMVIKSIIVTIFIFLLLFIMDPFLSIVVFFTIASMYWFLFRFVSRKLKKIGKRRAKDNRGRFLAVSELFDGIKMLIVFGRKEYFVNKFSVHSLSMSKNQALKSIITMMPKYIFEVITFGGILLIVLYFLYVGENMERVIPVLSLYAFAGYRLMPALQAIFTGVAEIRFTMPALDLLYNDLKSNRKIESLIDERDIYDPVPVRSKISLSNIYYTYPGQENDLFSGLNLTIKANSTVGIVGATGSGKTTIIDILLGLLVPADGEYEIDGIKVDATNILQVRKNIGYVPQEIVLIDDTIRRNIAFGLPDESIDEDAVRRAAKKANLDTFVNSELPHDYDTVVGERGIRLSGGQRQRIGIARALYHSPDLLVFDEATSALDGITESAVMEAINKLSDRKTIIMIAHRLTTLKDCDVIYVLEYGKVVAQGTYDDLMQSCSFFQKMGRAGQSYERH